MINKIYKGTFQGTEYQIRKLSASRALEVHTRLMYFLSSAFNETVEDPGKYLETIISGLFSDKSKVEDFTLFIKEVLTDGNVIVGKQKVTHLDDLERFDNIDGTEFLYELVHQWFILNVQSIMGKVGKSLSGLNKMESN